MKNQRKPSLESDYLPHYTTPFMTNLKSGFFAIYCWLLPQFCNCNSLSLKYCLSLYNGLSHEEENTGIG